MAKYVRKTCQGCKGKAHENPIEEAKCYFDTRMSMPDATLKFALDCVTLAYGRDMAEHIEKINKNQMAQYFT